MADSLITIDKANRMLIEAKDLTDLQQVRGIAAMAVEYAKAAKLGLDVQNTAAEIKIRAERRAGELLAELKREQGGDTRYGSPNVGGASDYSTALTESNTTTQDAGRWQKIATIPEDDFEETVTKVKDDGGQELTTSLMLKVADAQKTGQTLNNALLSSETNEWYTPAKYVDLARKAMGGIDLDPASCEYAQERYVQSKHYYTEADDGFSQPWFGNVWINPPYGKTGGKSNQEIWAIEAIKRYNEGEITQAIILLKAVIGYDWFDRLVVQYPMCFKVGLISFENTNNTTGDSKMGSAFMYIGPNEEAFVEVFKKIGWFNRLDIK